MAKVRGESKLREFALVGARVRIQELQAEISRIRKQFGQRILSGQSGGGTKTRGVTGTRRRRRRRMSAEARAKIAEAQRKRWAAQRAAGSKKK